jgi:flagellar protein FlaG
MGFSLTATQVIFFIASVIIASAVSGVFVAVINDVSNSFSERGERLQEQLDIEFKIINDPDNISLSGSYYLFYLKNIGGKEIATTNETFNLFIDGEIVLTNNYYFSENSTEPEKVCTIFIDSSGLSLGYHTLRIVGPQAIEDEFNFTI